MFRGNPPYGRLHVLSETYQKALVLPREIDVQIDKIQVSSLPADHPFPEETVLSLRDFPPEIFLFLKKFITRYQNNTLSLPSRFIKNPYKQPLR